MKAFFRPFFLPALFFSLLLAFFAPAPAVAGDIAAAPDRAGDSHPLPEKTRIIDLMTEGKIEPKRWYWIGDWAAPIKTSVTHPAKPRLTAEKAVPVSVAAHFERPQAGIWPFHGYLLDTVPLKDGKKGLVFKKEILIRHLVDRENLSDEKMRLAMQLDGKKPGVYVYRKKGAKLVEFALEDAPFAKRYFRALVGMDENGNRTCRINRVDVMPVQYTAWDYYPGGAVREVTRVMRAQTGLAPFYYTWKEQYSDDLMHPEKTGETPKSLVSEKNPLWLPNMLKTAG